MIDTPLGDLVLLGSSFGDGSLEPAVTAVSRKMDLFCDRIQSLDAHTALFFLVHHASVPRLSYVLRTSPVYKCVDALRAIDDRVHRALILATNVNIEGEAWMQASLPVRMGGLGVRRVLPLSLPCFIASLSSSLPLAREICPFWPAAGETDSLVSAIRQFKVVNGVTVVPSGDDATHQRNWDELASRAQLDGLLASANQVHRARLLAASAPHSGAWLHALPIPSLGLLLNDQTVRISVALRLGAPVCEPHPCRCGRQVDRLGHHGLSCRYSAGRFPRHANLNDVVKRGLTAAGIPSWLEPVGLDRGDGRRPDGITVFPYSRGKCLCWDATCIDTFSASAVMESALEPGSAARAAEDRKRERYSELSERYIFQPLAVETSGVLGPSSGKFLAQLGQRITSVTGERRELEWLRQRVSLAVARGNAVSILATGAVL